MRQQLVHRQRATRASDDLERAVPGRDREVTPARARLGDLNQSERRVAALVGLAVVMPVIVALVHFGPAWAPAGDTAFMGLRSLDVGTGRNPLLGQPSSSGHYVDAEDHVHHLGALHFYVMAPFVRLLGVSAGMLVVSALTTASMALMVTWVVYRNLGRSAAVMAAVMISAVMFGMGAGRLVNPVSSAYSGPCLLASAVLAWAVLSGDVRLFPLAAGVLTYTLQTHLAVGLPVVLLGLVAMVGVTIRWWPQRNVGLAGRRWRLVKAGRLTDGWRAGQRDARSITWRSVAGSEIAGTMLIGFGVALALMLPLFIEEATGDPGNLSALWDYAWDDEASANSVGTSAARAQVVHTLDVPPLFFNPHLTGDDLLAPSSSGAQRSARVVTAAVAGVSVWWAIRRDRRAWLGAMVGVLVLAGLVSGSRVPAGFESDRLVLYQWIWPLTFFVWLSLLLAGEELIRRGTGALRPRRAHGRHGRRLGSAGALPRAATGVCVALVVLPVVNNNLDRTSNARSAVHMEYDELVYRELSDSIVAAPELPDGPVLLVLRDTGLFNDLVQALAVGLEERGVSVQFPPRYESYAHADRVVDRESGVEAVVVAAVRRPFHPPPYDGPGRVVATWIWPAGAEDGSSFGSTPRSIDVFLVTDERHVDLMASNVASRKPLASGLDDGDPANLAAPA